MCFTIGAELMAINDFSEAIATQALFKTLQARSPAFWIGLYKTATNNLRWLDGSGAYYRSFGCSVLGAGGNAVAHVNSSLNRYQSWNFLADAGEAEGYVCERRPPKRSKRSGMFSQVAWLLVETFTCTFEHPPQNVWTFLESISVSIIEESTS